MSDNEKEETAPKVNEWEVVALTESIYAAAPSPKQDTLDYSDSKLIGDVSAETANAMLMSGHFGPKVHEDVPLEQKQEEKYPGEGHDNETMQQGGKSDSKHEENLHMEGLIPGEFHRVGHIDQDGSSYMANIDTGRIVDPIESLDNTINPGTSNVQKHIEEDESNPLPSYPCEAWWKRQAASLYDHARNANPYWSIVVTAAVMGLVIIGHRWQREKPQVFQLESKLAINDKGSGWILHPMARLKDVSFASQHISHI